MGACSSPSVTVSAWTRSPRAGQMVQRRLQHRPADIVEDDVHALGRQFPQAGPDVLGLVVDAGVEPGGPGDPVDLAGAPRDADDAAAPEPGHLSGEGADAARRAGDQDRLARHGPADVGDAEIGGQPAGAIQVQHRLGVDALRHLVEAEEARVPRQHVVLPARQSRHPVAHRQPVRPGRDDLPHARAAHHFAERDGRDVRRMLVQPGALGGFDGKPDDAHERLSRPRRGDGAVAPFEAGVGDGVPGTGLEHPLAIDGRAQGVSFSKAGPASRRAQSRMSSGQARVHLLKRARSDA
jgi:hypothetical protein